MARLLLVTLLAISGSALAQKNKDSSKPIAELEKWVKSEGGSFNTYVGKNEKGLRGLFVTKDAKKDEVLATIPASTIINTGHMTGNFMAPILHLLSLMRNPSTRFRPYINIFPKSGDVMNACTIKPEYFELLQSDYWIKFFSAWQEYMKSVIEGKVNEHLEYTIKETIGNDNVTLDEIKYICSMTSTRYVSSDRRKRLLMVPIYDLMNHKRDCVHYISSYDSADEIQVIAGKDVKAGEELCYAYGSMRDDYSVAHYGFLPDEEDPPRLLLVDHHQFKAEDDGTSIEDERFEGSPKDCFKESMRLKGILDAVEGMPPNKMVKKAGTDYVYDMLKELQARRIRALEYEIKRLRQIAEDAGEL